MIPKPGRIAPLLQALENNTIVDEICYKCSGFLLFPPLCDFIQTRDVLRKVVIDGSFLTTRCSERFMTAVANNPMIQSFILNHSPESITAKSWGILRSHPNLNEISFPMNSSPVRIKMIRQVIETCPSMKLVKLNAEDIHSENWISIRETLEKVQATLHLTLSLNSSRKEWMVHGIYDFLHLWSHPVHLDIDLSYLFTMLVQGQTSWMSHVLGPSVFALSLNSIIKRSEDIIHHLVESQNTTLKELVLIVNASECTKILSALQELAHLEKLTLIFLRRAEILPIKTQLLYAFDKNISIKKICICGYNMDEERPEDFGWISDEERPRWEFEEKPEEVEWTVNEQAKWQYIQNRNKSISVLRTTPDSFLLGVLPYVFHACPCNKVGATVIYESLRGLCEHLCDES
jgi:hypothetical protein